LLGPNTQRKRSFSCAEDLETRFHSLQLTVL
jgi:hypothetical protein